MNNKNIYVFRQYYTIGGYSEWRVLATRNQIIKLSEKAKRLAYIRNADWFIDNTKDYTHKVLEDGHVWCKTQVNLND